MTGRSDNDKGKPDDTPGGGPPDWVINKIRTKHPGIPAQVFAGLNGDDAETRKQLAPRLLAWMRGNGRKTL